MFAADKYLDPHAMAVAWRKFGWDAWLLTGAFVIPTLLGRLSPIPAGAGVTEAGMVGFLVLQTPMSADQAGGGSNVGTLTEQGAR